MASFINSILARIETDSPGQTASKPPPLRANAGPPNVAGVKRKAEGDLQRPGDKAAKVANNATVNVTREIKPLPQRSVTSSAVSTPNKPISNGVPRSAPVGTVGSKASIQTSNGRSTSANLKQTAPMSRSVTASSTTTRPLNGSTSKTASKPTPGQASTTQAPPKKGGFKAMLKQAQQAQQSKPQAVGSIVHKPAMSAKERLQQAKASKAVPLRGKAVNQAPTKLAANSKAVSRDGKDATGSTERYQGTARPNKPARPQPTYQGTARPSSKPQPQSGYKGTARPNSGPVSRAPAKQTKRHERNEYLGTDEEDEDGYGYDDDDRYEEASDDYSDMDAGFDDISDEEREAEKQAKADDRREQEMLDRLAREKAARKKSLGR